MAKKIVFLDRDGVINMERGEYTFKKSDFSIVPDLLDSMMLFFKAGYEFIVISNQGGISRKLYSKKDVIKLDNIIREAFVEQGMKVLDSFYCPHHNDNENCLCRKPKSLLLERAMAKHNIRSKDAIFIGDSERDKIAGENVGIKSFKVDANSSILVLSKTLIDE